MPRHYTKGLLGRPCPFCTLPVPKVLQAAQQEAHPCCGPSELDLINESRGASRRLIKGA